MMILEPKPFSFIYTTQGFTAAFFSPPASKYTFQKRSTVILCYSSVLGGLFKKIRMNKHTESVWAMQTKKRCMEKFIILIVIIQKIHSFDFRVHLFVSDIPTHSLTKKIHRSRKKRIQERRDHKQYAENGINFSQRIETKFICYFKSLGGPTQHQSK